MWIDERMEIRDKAFIYSVQTTSCTTKNYSTAVTGGHSLIISLNNRFVRDCIKLWLREEQKYSKYKMLELKTCCLWNYKWLMFRIMRATWSHEMVQKPKQLGRKFHRGLNKATRTSPPCMTCLCFGSPTVQLASKRPSMCDFVPSWIIKRTDWKLADVTVAT